MNKIVLFGIFAITLFFASCDSNKEVKQFAAEFASAVDKGDKAAIEKMYPDASAASSLTVVYNADSVSVEATENENQYVVNLNGKQSIVVEKKQEGQFSVLKSKGLFEYEPGVQEFCQALGCYDPALSDKDNAARMNDSSFVEYMNTRVAEEIKKHVRLEQKRYRGGDEESKISINIYNDSEFDLPQGSYVVTAKVYFQGDGRPSLTATHKFSEENIAKGETVFFVVPTPVSELVSEWVEEEFSLNKLDMTMLSKLYKPTGDEYANYLGAQ